MYRLGAKNCCDMPGDADVETCDTNTLSQGKNVYVHEHEVKHLFLPSAHELCTNILQERVMNTFAETTREQKTQILLEQSSRSTQHLYMSFSKDWLW